MLLERSHIPGPYVIAAHSLGGMYALGYALDSMHPQQTSMLAGADPLLGLLPTLARTGIARL